MNVKVIGIRTTKKADDLLQACLMSA